MNEEAQVVEPQVVEPGNNLQPATIMPPNAGKGRPKGVPNVTTREAKRLGVMLAEQEADNFAIWLHEVATTKPERACELYLDLLKLVIPQRSAAMSAEFVSGDSQSPFAMRFRGMFGNPPIEAPP